MEYQFEKRYKILNKLGQGGMGEVYKVEDTSTEKILALKLLNKAQKNLHLVSAFKREFYSLSNLKHPYLVEVYDLEKDDDAYYFTMEYIDGKDFISSTQNLEDKNIYSLIVKLCYALDYIHSQGIVHLDLKPSNILVYTMDSQNPSHIIKLTDFGLIQPMDNIESIATCGTPEYISPEVGLGHRVDQRTDLYSLGIILYEVFTKSLPFMGNSSLELIKHHINSLPTPPRKINPDIPEGLEHLILKLLEKNPTDRYYSAIEVIEEIEKISKSKFVNPVEYSRKEYPFAVKLIGRDDEINHLKGLLFLKNGKAVIITGDRGIGKTRLLDELKALAQIEEIPFIYTRLSETSDIYTEFMRQILINSKFSSIHNNYRTEIQRLISREQEKGIIKGEKTDSLFEELSEQNNEKINFIDRVTKLLSEISHRIPFGIFVDDLHLSGKDTLDLFQYLIRNIKSSNILLVSTCVLNENDYLINIAKQFRSEEQLELIELRGLSIKDTNSFIASMLGIPSQPTLALKRSRINIEFSKKVWEHTGGNPLFIDELIRALLINGTISLKDKNEIVITKQINETIDSMNINKAITERLNEVSAKTQNLLKCASLIGIEFEANVLKEVAKYDDIIFYNCLSEAMKSKIISQRFNTSKCEIYYFPNVSIINALSSNIEDKHSIHLSIASALEKILPDEIYRLAYHYKAGLNYQKALHYFILSGREAESRFHYNDAIEYYSEALQLAVSSGQFAIGSNETESIYTPQFTIRNLKSEQLAVDNLQLKTIYYGLARTHTIIGDLEKAIEFYNKILPIIENENDNIEKSSIYRAIGNTYRLIGKKEKALEYYKKSLKILPLIKEPQEKIKIFYRISEILAPTEKIDGMDRNYYFEQAINLSKQCNDKESLSKIYNHIAYIKLLDGDTESASKYCNDGLDIAIELQNDYLLAGSYHILGMVKQSKKEWKDALSCYKKSLSIREKMGALQECMWLYSSIGYAYMEMMDYSSSLEYHNKAIEIAERIGDVKEKSQAFRNIAGVNERTSDFKSALEKYYKSLTISEEINDKDGELRACNGIGAILIKEGKLEHSIEYLKRAINIANEIGDAQQKIKAYTLIIEAYNRISSAYIRELEFLKESSGITFPSLLPQFLADDIKTPTSQHELSKEFKILLDITRVINSILELDKLLIYVMDVVLEITGGERGFLMLIDENGNLYPKVAKNMDKENINEDIFKISKTISAQALNTGKAIYIPDIEQNANYREKASIMELHIRSAVCTPLKVKGKNIGVIYVDNRATMENLSSEKLIILEALSSHIATAIERAKLYEEIHSANRSLRKKLWDLSSLIDMSNEIASFLNKKSVLEKLLYTAVGYVGVETGFIMLADKERNEFIVKASIEPNQPKQTETNLKESAKLPLDSKLANLLRMKREPISVNELEENEIKKLVDLGVFLFLPIFSQEDLVGILCLGSRTRDRSYGSDEKEILMGLVNQSAVALENSALYEKIQELKIAHQLQMSLIPDSSLNIKGLNIGDDKDAKKLLERSEAILKEKCTDKGFGSMIGKSKGMQKVYETIAKVAPYEVSVLIYGESGTGKELVAKEIHKNSQRGNKEMVIISGANLSGELFESELFGHEKGAYTGAYQTEKGKIEMANGSTFFIDEVSELGLDIQAKFLRVLQEKEFYRVGGKKPINVDFRLICASNKDLEELVRQGKFREDLYYRINIFSISLPPLRTRKEDIPLLIEYFITKNKSAQAKGIKGFSPEVIDLFNKYHWGGNVRELLSVMESSVVFCQKNIITIDDLPDYIKKSVYGESTIRTKSNIIESEESTKIESKEEKTQPITLAELEKRHILDVLKYCNNNRTKTAEILGISRRHLQRKLKEFSESMNTIP